MSYKQEMVQELAKRIKSAGFRVFIAERGDYGFYTNEEGSRVISFGVDLGMTKFSGNYHTNNPKQTGTGWMMQHGGPEDYARLFDSAAPQWAHQGAKWDYTTLDQHLKTYGPSSKYAEFAA